MNNYLVDPPIEFIETKRIIINNYTYYLSNISSHKSVEYDIICYNNKEIVKTLAGLVDGEQYKEWVSDDWMDAFIKKKVEELNTST